MAIRDDLLGTGLRFPLIPDARGRLGYVEGQDNIEQSLRILLQTNLRERVMRSTFGTTAREQLFSPGSEKGLRVLERSLANALRDFEPRVEVLEVRAEAEPAEPSQINVRVDYQVRATYVRGSLIFPFYVGTGVPEARA